MNNHPCHYELVSEKIVIEEEEVVSYGVSVRQEGRETVRYADISPDRRKVEELVDRLNKMDARSVHLDDILQDFLP